MCFLVREFELVEPDGTMWKTESAGVEEKDSKKKEGGTETANSFDSSRESLFFLPCACSLWKRSGAISDF